MSAIYPYDIQNVQCMCDTVCNCKQFWEGDEPPFVEPSFDSRLNMPHTGRTILLDNQEYTLLPNYDILINRHYAGRILGFCAPYALVLWNGNIHHHACKIQYQEN